MPIIINLDVVMARRKIGAGELAEKVGITPATHTGYTLYFRDQVDLGIVLDKSLVVTVLGVIDGEHDQHGVLTFLGRHTDLGYFGRQQTLCHRNTVLHVYGSHIGIGSLFKVNGNIGRSVVGGIRGHVHHVLHTIDLVFQRRNHTIQYSLRVRTRISSSYRNGWRGDIRILGNRQG